MSKYTIRPRLTCECTDQGCPAHTGASYCREPTFVKNRLYRTDMEDASGTVFCLECLADALDSGVFTSERGER